jgi:hypothetical protein
MIHLEEKNESYFEHMSNALSISWLLLCLSLKCFIHSIIPDLYVNAVSSKIVDLNNLVDRE